MTKTIENFCGQENGYSRSITLRNKLIPIGKTADNLKQFLEKDQERADAYPEIKNLIDEIHRGFIEDTLTNFSFVWEPLFDDFELYQNEKDKSKKATKKKDLEKFQSRARKKIVEAFKKHPDYDKLFKDGLFKELLPALIENSSDTEISNKEEALKVFDRFSTYFVGFHENRKNMYSEEEKSTAISYRIVNENFPKFYANVKLYNYLKENFPQIISETEESLKNHLNGKKFDDIFNVESFNDVLAQSGIDFYNTVIGGISTETEKVQGLNEKINLARQQLISQISFLKNQNDLDNTEKIKELEKKADELKKKMVVLFKQILSKTNSKSFKIESLTSSKEVLFELEKFNETKIVPIIKSVQSFINSSKEFDYKKVFVSGKELTNFSSNIIGPWNFLSLALQYTKNEKYTFWNPEENEDVISKKLSKVEFSFEELQEAYDKYADSLSLKADKRKIIKDEYFKFYRYELIKDENGIIQKDNDGYVETEEFDILKEILSAYSKIDFENIHDLQQEKEAATPIKTYLDEVQNLFHHLKLVDYRGEEQKDSNFYSKLDEIITQLSEIIPLYNKVRNFVTKKPSEMKKIKMMFDCSSLLGGWGTDYGTKEAHIFIDSGKYYLGIINEKLSKDDVELLKKSSERMVTKVIYDFQKPDNKNTPRLFIRSKGTNYAPAVSQYNLPIESIIDIYDRGLFKTEYRKINPEVYKESLIKMIDYFKLGFERHESYKHYPFCWKESSKYNDIGEFYKDVINSCYHLHFEKVNYDNLLKLVENNKIFLFQIYNKDFASKASGKKNLHTLYWENLFSEENLKDVCLKLNGEAELFWRKPSLNKNKVTVHEKGSTLVNRTTSDGKSIPEDIYQEIYQFKNKMIDNLSENAKSLLDSGVVVCKEATHDITKDNRFTEDTYLFHCPITMNFKAPDKSNKEFNNQVLDVLSGNPNVKIIGLDRGERHLIYLIYQVP